MHPHQKQDKVSRKRFTLQFPGNYGLSLIPMGVSGKDNLRWFLYSTHRDSQERILEVLRFSLGKTVESMKAKWLSPSPERRMNDLPTSVLTSPSGFHRRRNERNSKLFRSPHHEREECLKLINQEAIARLRSDRLHNPVFDHNRPWNWCPSWIMVPSDYGTRTPSRTNRWVSITPNSILEGFSPIEQKNERKKGISLQSSTEHKAPWIVSPGSYIWVQMIRFQNNG